MEKAIEIEQLYFAYNDNPLFENLSLDFTKGKMHGLLGPNGAGKSTLIKLLSGLLLPHQGKVTVLGHSSEDQVELFGLSIGLLSDQAPLYISMTVHEYLTYCGVLKKMPKNKLEIRVKKLISDLDLQSVQNKLLKTLSTGFRQRVALAQALIHEPPILILDEPTSGLDPQSAANFREILTALKKNHTIIFSSHLLHEVENLCDEVTMVHRGKIVFHGMMEEALQEQKNFRYCLKVKQSKFTTMDQWYKILSKEITKIENKEGYSLVEFIINADNEVNNTVSKILNQNIEIIELALKKHDLEEKFLHLVKDAGKSS